ncbi:MAG: MFS transporter, partial [Candidatus Bipolaricaulia bacterium]
MNRARRERRISRNVLLLGLTSLLNDISSELIMAVLPGFIALLGGGGLGVGLIGGVEEGTKSILSIFAGHWSDRCGRRRPLVIGGYTVATLAKLGLYLSATWGQILGLRLLDRAGKGLRTAPRDAL